MGVVWKAFDTKLNRDVAIKFLQPGLTLDPERNRRFLREARAAAAVVHPNIATIHGIEEAEGFTFIVMELVKGRSLRSLLRGRPLAIGEALRVGIEVGEGLAFAHRAGVIHRDLKPDNIILDPGGRAKVLDFGLAKLIPGEDEGLEPTQARTLTAPLTQGRALLGTLDYMSPEQVRGEAVDVRSDLFSFGVVIYEMVTGTRPFPGPTPAARLSAILSIVPTPPEQLNPDVPPEVGRILAKCLEKEARERYQHADDIVVDLRRLERLPQPAATVRLPPPAGRRRWILGLGGIAALVALGVVLETSGLRHRLLGRAPTGRIESLAVLPLENLTGGADQDYFADGMTEELIATLAKIGSLRVISRTSVMPYKGARKPLREIGRDLDVDAVVEGSVRRSGGRVRITAQLVQVATDRHLWAESYERDLGDVLKLQSDLALAIARKIEAELTPQERARLASALTVNPEAQEAYLKGLDYLNRNSTEDFKRAAEYFERAIDLEPGHALAHVGLATYYSTGGFLFLPPSEAIPKARAEVMRALEIDEHLADAHVALGDIALDFDWDWPAAEREYRRAIELSPSSAMARSMYAWLLLLLGRTDEALVEYERAVKLNPLDLLTQAGPATHSFYTRQYARAIEQFRPILTAAPDLVVGHALIGCSLIETGRYVEGIAAFEKWLAITGREDGMALGGLGYAYARAGRVDDARKVLDEMVRLAKKTHVPPYYMAFIHVALGEDDRAFDALERSYANRDAFVPKLRMDPLMDGLRSDPRFDDLVRRIGLPP